MSEELHPCPCCGYLTHMFPLSESEICDICSWQNDAQDLAAVFSPRGPNHVSLIEAQGNFARMGASEERIVANARKPGPGDVRDAEWRAFNPERDTTRMPADYDEWRQFEKGPYYWRPSYWFRSAGEPG